MWKSVTIFFTNCYKSPKTSAMGIAAIAVFAKSVIQNPWGILTDANSMIALFVGIGLLFAGDATSRSVKIDT